ncbi:serine acetyltransferase [Collinsella ihumii]|uniref:serine acetyltransferase n=1 Tax=Collinsella ihumii TaxID=1720204 RepID=UPI00338DAF76
MEQLIMSFTQFKLDYYRYTGDTSLRLSAIARNHSLRFLLCLRGGVLLMPIRKHMQTKYGLELGRGTNLAPGIYLGHAYGVTINPKARIGKNCNLHKGCTIGQENRGKRKGAPMLGERVWVGANATVVGAITVGNDVLIAPNSYVNRDVPSHSVVIGNPCRIIARKNATEGYIENLV